MASTLETQLKFDLPADHRPYADKYFLRTNEVLKAEGLNPYVRAQVFIRKGPGTVHGIDEAVAILAKYSKLAEHGGKVYALPEGSAYHSKEALMVIEAPIQDIVELETMYLGVISAETTKTNDKHGVSTEAVRERMEEVVRAAGGRDVIYFGARHWRYDEDAAISFAAYLGGARAASTDAGAESFSKTGVGTIPHALENIMAWKHGYENAVVEATKAFDKHIDRNVPRIALIDYANKEITDTLATAQALGDKLYGVRVDTCGENTAEGADASSDRKYWGGRGVTISGVHALRTALDNAGRKDVKIVLSSGFGDVNKVRAFVAAEQELGTKLFDTLGVGGVYDSRMATMDIVAVGEDNEHLIPMAKVGRTYRPNNRLELVLGGN
jgi:nicotinate phosphoribosyltransferase